MPNKILTEQFEKALERSLDAKEWPKVTAGQRVATTGIGVGAGAGIPMLLGKIMKKQLLTKKLLIPSMIAGGALGFSAPDVVNRLLETEDKKKRRKYISQIPGQTERLIRDSLSKKASWKIIKNVAKYTAKGVRELARGVNLPLRMPKGSPLSEQALSIASKGAVGYGAYKGGQKLFSPPPPADYTTFLRNQILAGNIVPEQLSPRELEKVMQRGM